MEKLFSEFSGLSEQQWKDQIIKDLKGAEYASLTWHTNNGFDVKPFYTGENTEDRKPLFEFSDWDICEPIDVLDVKFANHQALQALKKGASGLVFNIHKKIDTKTLLKDISLYHIYSQFNISNDALHVLTDLKSIYGKPNSYDGKLKCFVNIDPIHLFALYGEWHDSQEKDLSALKQLVHIPINASLYQEAGCAQVNELAFTLAHCNEYFNYLNDTNSLNKPIHISVSVGGDFFTEIAKLRALRQLVALLQDAYGCKNELHIHAQTSMLNKSEKDAYTNLLRSTTEAMSAVIGGTNSLSISGYDQLFNQANEFSSRMAINQQHILKDESYLNKVADMAAGSYYIEQLTDQLAQNAWEKFKTLESKGGFIACIKTKYVQETIHADFNTLKENYKQNRSVLIGVNKFPNTTERKEVLKDKSESDKGVRITPKRLTEFL
ncbi:MAG: methylmalonyl-CoA mutase family protein [Bacteroidota bacterium]|nr:methylmalonyl-CoA mutase family protein [Bacteroidota bacterium]